MAHGPCTTLGRPLVSPGFVWGVELPDNPGHRRARQRRPVLAPFHPVKGLVSPLLIFAVVPLGSIRLICRNQPTKLAAQLLRG
jgi:hypothetical protein